MDFYDVVSTTRAMRRLDPDRAVPSDVLERLLRAATLGPSGGNSQPVRWLVVTDPDKRAALGDVYKRASEGIFAIYRKLAQNDPPDRIAKSVLHLVEHFGESPAIVVPCTRVKSLEDPNSFFPEPWDSPLLTLSSAVWPCVQNFCLAARAEGLGATPTVIHNILEPEARQILEIPDDVYMWCMLPVGYPLGKWGTPKRRSVEDVTYVDSWGSPWPAGQSKSAD